MKILLANLPWLDKGRIGVRAGSRWPHLKGQHEWAYLPFPFFLAYAAALLKKHNFEVELIDAIAEGISYEQLIRDINTGKPDLMVCETSTVTLHHDLEVLKKLNRDIPIALCGPDVNMRQPRFLSEYPFISYVLAGEYEFTLLELAQRLESGINLGGTPGLIYRDAHRVRINPLRPLINLDRLPWPLREGLPMAHYNDSPGDMPLPSVQMMASRGCPYHCAFCLWPQVMYQGSNYRTRNIIDVVDEMEYLAQGGYFKSIYFDDDTFNCGKPRMLELCGEIKARGLRIPWAIMARPDLMDEEVLEGMKGAGLYAVKYGVESGDQGLVDTINKRMDLKKTEEIIMLTKALDIKTHLTFTFGLPGETKETIRRTIDFALRLDPCSVQFSIATPFPGTAFYDEMAHKGHIISEKWADYDGNHTSVISYEGLSKKDLQRALGLAYKQWAYHCTRRRYLDGLSLNAYYFRLLKTYLKKYGFFITAVKASRFLGRFFTVAFKERVGCAAAKPRSGSDECRLKLGRLELVFSGDGLWFYWDGIRLTAGQGLASCITVKSDAPDAAYRIKPYFITEKLNDFSLLVTMRHSLPAIEEKWLIEIVDEKQIDWQVILETKENIEVAGAKVALVLSGRYKEWMDAWGDGGFYPPHEYREVPLRNPGTNFIGVRSRKRIKGKLPTVLLDLMGAGNGFCPAVRNSPLVPGARMLEIQIRHKDATRYTPGSHAFFLGRIKIVEDAPAQGSPKERRLFARTG